MGASTSKNRRSDFLREGGYFKKLLPVLTDIGTNDRNSRGTTRFKRPSECSTKIRKSNWGVVRGKFSRVDGLFAQEEEGGGRGIVSGGTRLFWARLQELQE